MSATLAHAEPTRSKIWPSLVTAFVIIVSLATPAWAHDETGNKACGVGDEVYTKIRYTDGWSQSYINATYGTTTKSHQTVDAWVNRYHQPRDGGAAYYELREETSTMSHTYSWAGCEA